MSKWTLNKNWEGKWLADEIEIDVWEERDRFSIVVSYVNGETIAEWWDEDARDMFEDGSFVSGKGKQKLEESVVRYMDEVGIKAPKKVVKKPKSSNWWKAGLSDFGCSCKSKD